MDPQLHWQICKGGKAEEEGVWFTALAGTGCQREESGNPPALASACFLFSCLSVCIKGFYDFTGFGENGSPFHLFDMP